MDVDMIPDALREVVRRDLRPVRPFASPWRRALPLAVLATGTAVAILRVYGVRADIARLGLVGWGPSAYEALLGFMLLALAFRESIPDISIDNSTLVLWIAVGTASLLVITAVTMHFSPTGPPGEKAGRFAIYCIERVALFGAPLILTAAALSARSPVFRPMSAGAFCGLGSGLFIDAVWRLSCSISEPSHVLLSHTGGVAALALLAVLMTHVVARVQDSP
jgi:hypothetical protein